MVGAHDEAVSRHRSCRVERVEDPAEPVVDHRELRCRSWPRMCRPSRSVSWSRTMAPSAYGGQMSRSSSTARRRSDRATAPACRTARAGRTRRRTATTGRGRRRVGEAAVGAAHHPRAGEVLLGPEERAGPVVAAGDAGRRRACARRTSRRARAGSVGVAEPRRVGVRPPRVALVAADVVPARRSRRGSSRRRSRRGAGGRSRASWSPRMRRSTRVIGCSHSSIEPHGFQRKSSAPHEDVVAGRHARQRTGDVPGEAGRRARGRSGRGSGVANSVPP